jgi:hypothetical protein
MTDWRQIQARIRKAKNSPDALTKLSELFQRTRDGMVAWEIGVIEEKSERLDDAVKWYTVAAERFRRAEWKKKAEEALTRLGAPLPVASDPSHQQHNSDTDMPHESTEKMTETNNTEIPQVVARPSIASEVPQLAYGEIPPDASQDSDASAAGENAGSANHSNNDPKRKRRRGRRGGRGRRRKDAAAAPSLPTQAFAESIESQPQPVPVAASKPDLPAPLPFRQPESKFARAENSAAVERERATPEPIRPASFEPAPQLPSSRSAHGRAGDPALASRMAHLESMLRRLLSSPLRRLDDADQAPAGPGVFLLSDSDQVTSYYVESCQTLRVGLGNLSRGNRSAKSNRGGSTAGRGYSESGLKAKLAEHLGINEAKVGQYMKDHCVVRWIQLDDEAHHLAHFAIGVLRTPLNLDE